MEFLRRSLFNHSRSMLVFKFNNGKNNRVIKVFPKTFTKSLTLDKLRHISQSRNAAMNSSLSIFFKNFFRKETTNRAIKLALVVAPILIIINHHDEILDLNFTRLFFIKCALTFLVPYCVSAFSSARAYSSQE
jgi:hypothetical protein